jgi:geranylgeranyl pyrophosphate synthase
MVLADTVEAVTLPEISGNVHSLIQSAFSGGEALDPGHPVHAAFVYHFTSKGGGTRAQLTCSTARLLGQSMEDGCCMAAAVECLHNASLVQDDMQDRSFMRRGQRSVASVFGDHIALGLTDRLITTAFACLAPISKPRKLPALIRRMNQAVAKTVDGQASELSWNSDEVPFEARVVAATQKSGPLFALSLELPLILADQEEWVELAHRAACQFGLGYQILDDINDKSADAKARAPGNLVLAMEADHSLQAGEGDAAGLAQQNLVAASTQAEELPHGAGLPLIGMVEKLLSQVDVVCT